MINIQGAIMAKSYHNFNHLSQKQKKREAPFSLRLSFEERAALETVAGDIPLGAYIKAVLFGQDHPSCTNPDHREECGRMGRPLACARSFKRRAWS